MTRKRSNLKVVFLPTREQIQLIQTRVEELDQRSDAELIESYNSKANIGLFGVMSQTQEVVSLALTLKRRFGDPIVHLDNNIVFLPCTVELLEDGNLLKSAFTDWE